MIPLSVPHFCPHCGHKATLGAKLNTDTLLECTFDGCRRLTWADLDVVRFAKLECPTCHDEIGAPGCRHPVQP